MIKPTLLMPSKSSLLNTELPENGFKCLALHAMKRRFSLQKLALVSIPNLFTDFAESKKLWEEAYKEEHYNGYEFCFAIYQAFVGSDSAEDTLTVKERDKWREKVQSTSSELYELISGTRYSEFLEKRCFDLLQNVKEALSDELGGEIPQNLASRLNFVFFQHLFSLPLVLDDLSKTHESDVNNWMDLSDGPKGITEVNFTMKRPNDSDSQRAFFIRFMTEFFKVRTNKPQRPRVKILVEKLFGPIDSKTIRDLTK